MAKRLQNIAFYSDTTSQSIPLVGISACLAGQQVRWDGTDKRLDNLSTVQSRFKLLPICPEAEAGLGIPRPPVQLVLTDAGPQALGRDDPDFDVTDALLKHRSHRYRQLLTEPICGYIFKARSPSCGLASAPVCSDGEPIYYDNGLFADGLLRMFPWLITCDESQLEDDEGLDRFVRGCQLVQEILYDTGMDSLTDIHEHYLAQLGEVDKYSIELLEAYATRENRQKYLELLLDYLGVEGESA